jgi:hypothetical protein
MVKPGIEVLFSAQPVLANKKKKIKIKMFLVTDINKLLLVRCRPGWPVHIVVSV